MKHVTEFYRRGAGDDLMLTAIPHPILNESNGLGVKCGGGPRRRLDIPLVRKFSAIGCIS
ncbi:hypothetical protein G9P44_000686 [Scheffersomyces stipitis]|nr:hypothetical protein G9P44_000686 [Scheffersomyces stipitis]